MSEINAFKALSLCATICVGISVVAACTIHLRGDENQPLSTASVVRESDTMTAKLAQCRTISYEQADRLAECRKIWADKRKHFLGQDGGSPSQLGIDDPGVPLPSSKDQSRLPSGLLPTPMESER